MDRTEALAPEVIERAARAQHDESARYIGCNVQWDVHGEGFKDRTRAQVRVVIEAVFGGSA